VTLREPWQARIDASERRVPPWTVGGRNYSGEMTHVLDFQKYFKEGGARHSGFFDFARAR